MDGSGRGDDDDTLMVEPKLKEHNLLRGIGPAARVSLFTTDACRSSEDPRYEMALETVIASRSGHYHEHQREKPHADIALFLPPDSPQTPPDSPQPLSNDDTPQSRKQLQQLNHHHHPQHGGGGGGSGRQASPPEKVVLSARFNQDYGCFACGTQTGFRVYSCHPFGETFRREFDASGIGLVEMLFRCNIIALVGGGKAPKYSPNKVMIWDDHQGRCIGELTFRSEVRSVRLRRDYIVVVLEHKIYAYGLSDLVSVDSIETLANPKGLCVISYATNSYVLVCPGQRRGQVLVKLYSLNQTQIIQAHDSALACFGLTWDGSILATASTKGTLIRIFNTHDGTKLQELRRGADRADIYSIAFSSNTQWLVVSSDKGTVHVFSLKRADLRRSGDGQLGLNSNSGSLMMAGSALLSFATSNAGSSLAFMKGVLPKYFSSEWSFAQFHVPEDTYAIAAFGPEKNTIVLVCTNGSFYRCAFDPVHGGEMVQQQHERFMTPDAEETLLPLRL